MEGENDRGLKREALEKPPDASAIPENGNFGLQYMAFQQKSKRRTSLYGFANAFTGSVKEAPEGYRATPLVIRTSSIAPFLQS